MYSAVVVLVWGLVLACGAFLLGRGAGTVATHLDLAPGKRAAAFRTLRYLVVVVGFVGGVYAVLVSPPSLTTTRLTPPGAVETALAVATNAAALAVLVLGTFEAYRLGVAPGFDAMREGTFTPPAWVRRRQRTATAGALVVVGVAVEAPRTAALPLPLWALPVVGVLVLGAHYVLSPTAAVPALRSEYALRDPTEDERARIEACYDRLDRDAPWVVVAEQEVGGSVVASRTGPRRALVVGEPFLASVDDDALAVALVGAEGRARGRFMTHLAADVTGVGLLVVLAGALSTGWLPVAVGAGAETMTRVLVALATLLAATLAVVFGVFLPVHRRQRHVVYRADAAAADALGAEVVRSVYAEYGAALCLTGETGDGLLGNISARNSPEPPMRSRRAALASDDGSAGRPGHGAAGGGFLADLVDANPRAALVVAGPFLAFLSLGVPAAAADLAADAGWVARAAVEPYIAPLGVVYFFAAVLTGAAAAVGLRRLRERPGRLSWVPPRPYYALAVPMVNAIVAMLFFMHRTARVSTGTESAPDRTAD